MEVRFLKGLDIKTTTAPSVAVTAVEHQKFTNAWRLYFPYGKTDYTALGRDEIWEAAKNIYREYPELLEAVWDTLF